MLFRFAAPKGDKGLVEFAGFQVFKGAIFAPLQMFFSCHIPSSLVINSMIENARVVCGLGGGEVFKAVWAEVNIKAVGGI